MLLHSLAIKNIPSILPTSPHNCSLHSLFLVVPFSRGKARVDLKKHEEAVEDFTQAIDIKADFAEAYFDRGKAKVDLKQYEEAIEDFTQSITIKPNYGTYLSKCQGTETSCQDLLLSVISWISIWS